ncbi:MAG: NAD(P)H-dependent oxidoreductase [Bacteroidota bacterium]
MKIVIIQGSAAARGNSYRIGQLLKVALQADYMDLLDYDFSGFDYKHANRGDDFLPLMRRLIEQYDCLVFITPVYWYSMSGLMKHFFDRISDLLKIEKTLGRQLRGKRMASVSVSGDATEYPSVQQPFELSADYLGMHYSGHLHTWVEGESVTEIVLAKLPAFVQKLRRK